MGSVINEITTPVDAELKRTNGQKKINKLANDKMSTHHSE